MCRTVVFVVAGRAEARRTLPVDDIVCGTGFLSLSISLSLLIAFWLACLSFSPCLRSHCSSQFPLISGTVSDRRPGLRWQAHSRPLVVRDAGIEGHEGRRAGFATHFRPEPGHFDVPGRPYGEEEGPLGVHGTHSSPRLQICLSRFERPAFVGAAVLVGLSYWGMASKERGSLGDQAFPCLSKRFTAIKTCLRSTCM